MTDVFGTLKAAKSYIAMVIVGVLGILHGFEVITVEQLATWTALIGSVGGIALVAGQKKAKK